MEENNTARPHQQPHQQQQQQQVMERRVRPQKEQALHCPRCNSTNTKFCYYNNYSLTQPRYFCKTCRRYWTEGGSLRNVPVGGGSRKNKRSSSSSSTSSSTTTTTTTSSLPTLSSSSKNIIPISTQNPKFHEGQDLNLAFHLPEFNSHDHFPSNMETNCNSATAPLSAMELLRSTGGISGRGLNIPFMPMSTDQYPSGFGVQDYMRSNTLSFPLDSISEQRLLFPFEDSRQHHVPSNDDERFNDQQNRGQGGENPPGFWNGMIGGNGGGSNGGGGSGTGSW